LIKQCHIKATVHLVTEEQQFCKTFFQDHIFDSTLVSASTQIIKSH